MSHLWKCAVCGAECDWSDPPRTCAACGHGHLAPVVFRATHDPITTFRRECAALLERYVDDVNVLVAGFLAEAQAAISTREMATIREALGLSTTACVEYGTVSGAGLGYAPDDDRHTVLRCFWARNVGKRVRATYEIVEELHDTERPPAFAAEAGTFEPTTRTLGDDDEVLQRHEMPSELRWEATTGER